MPLRKKGPCSGLSVLSGGSAHTAPESLWTTHRGRTHARSQDTEQERRDAHGRMCLLWSNRQGPLRIALGALPVPGVPGSGQGGPCRAGHRVRFLQGHRPMPRPAPSLHRLRRQGHGDHPEGIGTMSGLLREGHRRARSFAVRHVRRHGSCPQERGGAGSEHQEQGPLEPVGTEQHEGRPKEPKNAAFVTWFGRQERFGPRREQLFGDCACCATLLYQRGETAHAHGRDRDSSGAAPAANEPQARSTGSPASARASHAVEHESLAHE